MSGFRPPSVFAPLSRRFGNERQRELNETAQLYAWVHANQARFTETAGSMAEPIFPMLFDLTDELSDHLIMAASEIYDAEPYFRPLEARDLGRLSMTEFVEYRAELYARQYFLANHADIVGLFKEGLERIFRGITEYLPKTESPSPFTIPLIFAIERPVDLLEGLIGFFAQDEFLDRGLFKSISRQLFLNMCAIAGIEPELARPTHPKWKQVRESTLALDERVRAYFAGTPFADLLLAPVPLKLTHEDRFNHMHVLGGSGAGKTTLIENLLRYDLKGDKLASIVLIDPHSDLTRKLVRSDLGIGDRVILIDPRDTQYPLALNPFAINRDRFAQYDEATREQVTAGVIQTLGYFWSGLTSLSLTGKQDVFFRYVTRLLLTLPEVEGRNATILDMLQLMQDPVPYGRAIEALPDIPREFFKHDFMSKSFEGTKEQIRYRIQAIIENPTMARLFTAPETKIDFFTEMNRGSVILVDTAKDFLKEASATFGKLIISLVLQAILERAAIDARHRTATFIMVDEAGSFFSNNIDDLLTEARKYRAGLVLAHQYLDQASSSLRASLAANTGAKFASGLSAQDAGTMARDMRTTPEFILSQPRLSFAAHVRNVTTSAISVPISFVQGAPQLDDEGYAQFIARNRSRVSLAGATKHETSEPPSSSGTPGVEDPISHRSPGAKMNFWERGEGEPPGKDISTEWK